MSRHTHSHSTVQTQHDDKVELPSAYAHAHAHAHAQDEFPSWLDLSTKTPGRWEGEDSLPFRDSSQKYPLKRGGGTWGIFFM